MKAENFVFPLFFLTLLAVAIGMGAWVSPIFFGAVPLLALMLYVVCKEEFKR